MVIYLDAHKPARVLSDRIAYADEVMNSNWNPAVVHIANDVAQWESSPELPVDLGSVDADEFLGRVYALATQI